MYWYGYNSAMKDLFSSASIQRKAWLRGDAALIEGYLHQAHSRVLLRFGEQWLMASERSPGFEWRALAALSTCLGEPLYLGEHRQCHFFCCELHQWHDYFAPFQRLNLRAACRALDEAGMSLLFYAQGLLNWHRNHSFCSTCGSATRVQQAGHARACVNPDCAIDYYPKLDPAVIFSIVNNNGPEPRLLLARKKDWDAHRYSVIAGFVESGETLEDAVRREAYEETGLVVEQVRYIASQPWPFPDALMLGFSCQTRQEDITLVDQELETARWFTHTQIQQMTRAGTFKMPFEFSIAWHLVNRWLLRQST